MTTKNEPTPKPVPGDPVGYVAVWEENPGTCSGCEHFALSCRDISCRDHLRPEGRGVIFKRIKPKHTPYPTKPYRFRARRFQDIDLARISREIGDAPYATVEWGKQSMVIAGEAAVRRAEAVHYDPENTSGSRVVSIDHTGQPARTYPRTDNGVWVWHDGGGSLLAPAHHRAAEWWAEVRRRERPDVMVTVTPTDY